MQAPLGCSAIGRQASAIAAWIPWVTELRAKVQNVSVAGGYQPRSPMGADARSMSGGQNSFVQTLVAPPKV